jgi:hypothetical protein
MNFLIQVTKGTNTNQKNLFTLQQLIDSEKFIGCVTGIVPKKVLTSGTVVDCAQLTFLCQGILKNQSCKILIHLSALVCLSSSFRCQKQDSSPDGDLLYSSLKEGVLCFHYQFLFCSTLPGSCQREDKTGIYRL